MSMRTAMTLSQVCAYLGADLELVREFADFGLYPTVLMDDELGVDTRDLERLGKVVSLHRALGINKEGIEAVLGLRARVSELEAEVEGLRSENMKLKRRLESESPESLELLGLLVRIDSLE
jgi:hypothetical protein